MELTTLHYAAIAGGILVVAVFLRWIMLEMRTQGRETLKSLPGVDVTLHIALPVRINQVRNGWEIRLDNRVVCNGPDIKAALDAMNLEIMAAATDDPNVRLALNDYIAQGQPAAESDPAGSERTDGTPEKA